MFLITLEALFGVDSWRFGVSGGLEEDFLRVKHSRVHSHRLQLAGFKAWFSTLNYGRTRTNYSSLTSY